MSRFYVRPESIKNNKIYIDGSEAHHIKDVMRLKKRDSIIAFDGTGKEYIGTIEDISRYGIIVRIDKIRSLITKKTYRFALAQALPKMDKMDFIVQKASELGADSIIPMHTKRTIIKLDRDRFKDKRKRWETIAEESAKQCGRADLIKIEEYADFKEVLETVPSYDLAIMPTLGVERKERLKDILADFHGSSILIFIGPEGGFTPLEVESALKKNVFIVSLGENILRCDTAALVILSIINYALGSI